MFFIEKTLFVLWRLLFPFFEISLFRPTDNKQVNTVLLKVITCQTENPYLFRLTGQKKWNVPILNLRRIHTTDGEREKNMWSSLVEVCIMLFLGVSPPIGSEWRGRPERHSLCQSETRYRCHEETESTGAGGSGTARKGGSTVGCREGGSVVGGSRLLVMACYTRWAGTREGPGEGLRPGMEVRQKIEIFKYFCR